MTKSSIIELPSILKPRHVQSSRNSVASLRSFRSHQRLQFKDESSDDERVTTDFTNKIVDDNMSITDTIKHLWQKKRRRSKYRERESQETLARFVNIAKVLLLMFFISWNIRIYNKSSSLSSLSNNTIGDVSKAHPVSSGEISAISEESRSAMMAKLQKIKDSEVDVPRLATKPSRVREHNPTLLIPKNIDSFYADVLSPRQTSDTPVFWHILKSGGTSMKDIFGQCMGMVEASEAGVLDGHINDSTIQKISLGSELQYVNVDTTTAKGITRAINMKLIESRMADVIFTPLLHDSSQLFNNTANHKGRVFGLFRHPVERAVSLFHYLKKATWEPTFSERLKKIESIEDYAISEFAEDNWMVRFLTNKMTQMLTQDDLNVAKEILRRKVIVGLVLDVRGAVERYFSYFGWDYNTLNPEQQNCLNKYLATGSNQNAHDIVEEGTMGWRILRANNLLDLELYDYVLQLYEEQGKMLLGVA